MYKTLQRLKLDKAVTFYFRSETEIERFFATANTNTVLQ